MAEQDNWQHNITDERHGDSKENDSSSESEEVFIIAVTCFCVIGLLVVTALVFITWLCYVNRREKQSKSWKARRKEHLKYLEEYSIRTEDEEQDNVSSTQISPRSVTSSIGNGSVRSKNGATNPNDSGFGLEDWSPHKVDHSTSLEASNASSALSPAQKSDRNGNLSSAHDEYDNIDSELSTNIDDVKL